MNGPTLVQNYKFKSEIKNNHYLYDCFFERKHPVEYHQSLFNEVFKVRVFNNKTNYLDLEFELRADGHKKELKFKSYVKDYSPIFEDVENLNCQTDNLDEFELSVLKKVVDLLKQIPNLYKEQNKF